MSVGNTKCKKIKKVGDVDKKQSGGKTERQRQDIIKSVGSWRIKKKQSGGNVDKDELGREFAKWSGWKY